MCGILDITGSLGAEIHDGEQRQVLTQAGSVHRLPQRGGSASRSVPSRNVDDPHARGAARLEPPSSLAGSGFSRAEARRIIIAVPKLYW